MYPTFYRFVKFDRWNYGKPRIGRSQRLMFCFVFCEHYDFVAIVTDSIIDTDIDHL